MEGAEFKYWINRLNYLFETHGINDETNFWNSQTLEEDNLAYFEDLSQFIKNLFFDNRYVQYVSPEVGFTKHSTVAQSAIIWWFPDCRGQM